MPSLHTRALIAAVSLGIACSCAAEPGIPNCDWKAGADLQPCVQAALAEASGGHGTVLVPAGIWSLGKPLVLPSNVTLAGEAPGTTFVPEPDNASNPVLLKGYQVNGVVVKSITFDGNGGDFDNAHPLIEFAKTDGLRMENITVQHSRGIGLLLEGGVSNTVVSHGTFVDLGNHWKTTHQRQHRIQGVVLCCGVNTNNEVDDSDFSDIGLDALQFSNQTGFRILRNTFKLENSQRESVESPDYPAGIFSTYSSNGLIQGNKIEGAQGNGIDAPALTNTIIENNEIVGSGAAGIGIFPGYDKVSHASNVTIERNTVTDNVQWGAKSTFQGGITIVGTGADHIVIRHNKLVDDQGRKTQAYGIMIIDRPHASGLTIVDNVFEGNAVSRTN